LPWSRLLRLRSASGQASSHSDPTAVEDLAGTGRASSKSSVTGEIGTFTLDLTAAHNRQLDGTLFSPRPRHARFSSSRSRSCPRCSCRLGSRAPFVRDDGQTGEIIVVCRQGGSDFQGVATFGAVPFPFLGSIDALDDHEMAPVHALSVSPAGTLLIAGDWNGASPQPHLDGMVIAIFADGSVRTADLELVPAV
jgi:hypothetical protein